MFNISKYFTRSRYLESIKGPFQKSKLKCSRNESNWIMSVPEKYINIHGGEFRYPDSERRLGIHRLLLQKVWEF